MVAEILLTISGTAVLLFRLDISSIPTDATLHDPVAIHEAVLYINAEA